MQYHNNVLVMLKDVLKIILCVFSNIFVVSDGGMM